MKMALIDSLGVALFGCVPLFEEVCHWEGGLWSFRSSSQAQCLFFFLSACSEPATWISSLSAKDRQTKQESRGTALPDSELVIIDEFSNTVFDARREGEIVSVGGHVSMGFANDYQALSEEDRNSAILYTGISGYLDEDGYLYVTGRK